MPLEVELVKASPLFACQAFASRAAGLKRLGMTDTAIARAFGLSDKTVAKAIHWAHRTDADRG